MAASQTQNTASFTNNDDIITPKRRIIANQTAELVQLNQKLAHYEDVAQRFEAQKAMLSNAIAAKQALQEIFFNVSSEKRELESSHSSLLSALEAKDRALQTHRQKHQRELASLSRLHALKLSAAQTAAHKLATLSVIQNTEHSFQRSLSTSKQRTLSAKYRFASSQSKLLSSQLKLIHQSSRIDSDLARSVDAQQSQFELILFKLVQRNAHLRKRVRSFEASTATLKTEFEQRFAVSRALHRENEEIRALYRSLSIVAAKRETEIVRLSALSDRFSVNLAAKSEAHSSTAKHFARDLAAKERAIVKLENALAAATQSNVEAPALMAKEKALVREMSSLKGERDLLKQKVSHLEDSAMAQTRFVSTLRTQMSQMQSQVATLHEERANLQVSAEGAHARSVSLGEQYKALQLKAHKLTIKLKGVLSDKKKLKKGVKEREARLSSLLRENERIESNTDKQCEAAQAQLAQYKAKLTKAKDVLSGVERENAAFAVRNEALAKENESHRYLIEELEGDTEADREREKRRREKKRRRRGMLDRATAETGNARRECEEAMAEAEMDGDGDGEEDFDLESELRATTESKKRRSVEMEAEAEVDGDAEMGGGSESGVGASGGGVEPRRKKARQYREDVQEAEEEEDGDGREMSSTPFRADASLFRERKKRTKKNVNLPKPRLE